MDAILNLKEQGSAQFKDKRYADAIASWSHALDQLSSSEIAQVQARDQEIQTLKTLILSNRSAAYLKLERYEQAFIDATAALQLNSTHVKALYRQATALKYLNKHEEALIVAKKALQQEPNNVDIKQLVRSLQKKPNGTTNTNGATASTSKPKITVSDNPYLLDNIPFLYESSADGVDENLLICLHGLGDKPEPFMKLAKTLNLPQTALLALGGIYELPFTDGGRSWFTVFDDNYELIQAGDGEKRRLTSLRSTVAQLYNLLEALETREHGENWPMKKIHFLGFSQGGTTALALTKHCLEMKTPIGSCVAISAGLLDEQVNRAHRSTTNGGSTNKTSNKTTSSTTSVLFTLGIRDDRVSKDLLDKTAALLTKHGAACEDIFIVPNKGHEMIKGETEVRKLMEFWAKNLKYRPLQFDDDSGRGLIEVTPDTVEKVT